MSHDHLELATHYPHRGSAGELGELLRRKGDRLVLAESCTCGLAAAKLGGIPGISEVFCGSIVVYRTQTKQDWLDIHTELLNDPAKGPVSMECSRALTSAILDKTPEATVAASITGHLGPDSPSRDGHIYIAIQYRSQPDRWIEHPILLQSPSPTSRSDSQGRQRRQEEAVDWFLACIAQSIVIP